MVWITSLTSKALTPNAIALGNFDGLHLGHRQVIQPILAQGKEHNCHKTVVTFNPHPQEFFSGQSQQLLTTIGEKADQLEFLGIEQLILLPFNQELASLNPQHFVENILIKELKAKVISVGQDFRFGYLRKGTVEDLKEIASQFGVEVYVTPLKTDENNQRISSSAIREALREGKVEKVTEFLGRAYTLTGKVIQGNKLGRKIGFPTVNLAIDPFKFIPRQGVYSVTVFLHKNVNYYQWESHWQEKLINQGLQYNSDLLLDQVVKGVMNIGSRPTLNGSKQSVEVHLLNWSGELYDQILTVNLHRFLRPESKFNSLEELQQQIKIDCENAWLKTEIKRI